MKMHARHRLIRALMVLVLASLPVVVNCSDQNAYFYSGLGYLDDMVILEPTNRRITYGDILVDAHYCEADGEFICVCGGPLCLYVPTELGARSHGKPVE